jgi:hypothetical protein
MTHCHLVPRLVTKGPILLSLYAFMKSIRTYLLQGQAQWVVFFDIRIFHYSYLDINHYTNRSGGCTENRIQIQLVKGTIV